MWRGQEQSGQNAITMSQVQPHTISKKSRSCESCHTSKKALGMGINGGKYFSDPSQDTVIDLMSVDEKILPKRVDTQIPAIPNSNMTTP